MRIFVIIAVLALISGCEEQSKTVNNSSQKPPFHLIDLPIKHSLFEHRQKFSKDFKIHEPLGSGIAVIDINNDGQFELFFAQFDHDPNHTHPSSVLYQKNNQHYLDITSSVGLSGLNNIMGAAVADVNNDGWSDLLAYGYKTLHLMINQKGTFKRLELNQFVLDDFYTSATFFNANNDEWLDLWLSTYVEVETDKEVICKSSDQKRMHCAPSALPFQKDKLLINNNGQFFTQASDDMISIKAAPALGVVAADFNQDQLADIYVANDGQENFLFTQKTDGSFEEQAQQKGVATNMAGLTEASMGIAIGDYDNDGLDDLFLTHIDGESNTLYKNEKTWFSDVTNTTGLAANSRVLTGFGTGFYDLNGDNLLDIFVSNGRIQAKPYQSSENQIEQFSEQPLLYFNNPDNKFTAIQPLADKPIKSVGRGLAFIDLDHDGDKDMIISNNNQKPLFLDNQLNPQRWIGLNIRCHQRTMTGARVIFTLNNQEKFYRTIHTDGSYVSAHDPRIIIYLDNNDKLTSLVIKTTAADDHTINIDSLVKRQYNNIDCLD